MSEACAAESCESKLGISCHCCNKHFCPDHLDEHYEFVNNQLKPLINQIEELSKQITGKMRECLIGSSLDKLDVWRDESHQTIDRWYQQKRQELEHHYERKLEEPQTNINQIQTKLNQLIHEQNATEEDIQSSQVMINTIERQIRDILKTSLEIHIRPLEIFDHFASIEETQSNQIDLTRLSSPYQTMDCPDEFPFECAATNANFLLIKKDSELILFDQQLTLVKTMSWKNCDIRDMCWSSTLGKFIGLSYNKGVYLIDENLTSVKEIPIDPKQIWWHCTCSDTSLYLIDTRHQTEIFQFDLLSSFQLIQRWKNLHLKENDAIVDLHYHNQTLALLIANKKRTCFELRSSITLDRIWSIQIDGNCSGIFPSISHCCLLNCDDWLVMDSRNAHLLHINRNGTIRSTVEYQAPPRDVLVFGSNILIIKTDKRWNFHQF